MFKKIVSLFLILIIFTTGCSNQKTSKLINYDDGVLKFDYNSEKLAIYEMENNEDLSMIMIAEKGNEDFNRCVTIGFEKEIKKETDIELELLTFKNNLKRNGIVTDIKSKINIYTKINQKKAIQNYEFLDNKRDTPIAVFTQVIQDNDSVVTIFSILNKDTNENLLDEFYLVLNSLNFYGKEYKTNKNTKPYIE